MAVEIHQFPTKCTTVACPFLPCALTSDQEMTLMDIATCPIPTNGSNSVSDDCNVGSGVIHLTRSSPTKNMIDVQKIPQCKPKYIDL